MVFIAALQLRAGQQPPPPRVVVSDYDMQAAAESVALPADALAGKKLFVQRCALCHDPLGQPATTTLGPWLDTTTVEGRGESAVRQTILTGSRRMPGWRYTLTAEQVDHVIAYLRTVTPDQKPVPPARVVIPLD
ncbi:MAG: cytochrome c [Acidimicrobiia bacterium]|nr:cytochrome c [Acidimicrobiia bacterium]